VADIVDNADRLTADAFHLAISLDSFTTLDWAERIGLAVQRGGQQLVSLQRRRELLRLHRCDDAIIDCVLDTIDARLNFLQSLLTPTMQNQECRSQPQAEPASRPFP